MKQFIIFVLSLSFYNNIFCQGVTLLYKEPLGWNNPLSWIQINTPGGGTPIQRVPTELDDVVVSKSLSGISSANFSADNVHTDFFVGSSNTVGYRCRSMHISNTAVRFETTVSSELAPSIKVYTHNGGSVTIDSGSNVFSGHFQLHGGNPSITDLQVLYSSFGNFIVNEYKSSLEWESGGRVKLVASAVGGYTIGNESGGNFYADSCIFETYTFKLGSNSNATLLNSTVRNYLDNGVFTFFIGRNANFVSDNVRLEPAQGFNFTSSGSVLNGHLTTTSGYAGGSSNFLQQDPANPLPNIINGNVRVGEVNNIGICGDLKISGDLTGFTSDFYNNPAMLQVNAQNVFNVAGVKNYKGNLTIDNCADHFCHYKLEFFGSTNSNIHWNAAFPVDTLVVNKTGCAKVTASNSLYVSGVTRIESGQLVLDPNDAIPFKFVCLGDLKIMQGAGIFLGKNSAGLAASMAIQGNLYDYNPVADSTCAGLSNPYAGDITLYRNNNNGGDNIISISAIDNLRLIGRPGSGFILANDLTVYDAVNIVSGELNLNNYQLVVKKRTNKQ